MSPTGRKDDDPPKERLTTVLRMKGCAPLIRILCVEDNPLVRSYLEQRFALEPDIQVVSTVSHARGALIYLRHEPIDVLLLDYQLEHEDGMHVLDTLMEWHGWSAAPHGAPAILFCTGYADEAFEAHVRSKGASGVVAKTRIARDLVPAVRAVAEGGEWFSLRSRLAESEAKAQQQAQDRKPSQTKTRNLW
jgi:DNA-binding NarL/FixJ family response regulator